MKGVWASPNNMIYVHDNQFNDDPENDVIKFFKHIKLYPDNNSKIIYTAKWYGSGISVDACADDLIFFQNGMVDEGDDDKECDNVHYRAVFEVDYKYCFAYFDAVNVKKNESESGIKWIKMCNNSFFFGTNV